MDPLSITTGVVALGTLAVTVTKTVNDIKKSLKTADQSLDDLTSEVGRLTSYLTTVATSLSDARSSSLEVVRIDDKLWEQSEVALSACNITLKEITIVLGDISKAAKARNGLNRKAKIAACLHGKKAELASLRDRVGKSNCALQTILHIIQVHVSIQNGETQDLIMRKLEELKVSIDTSTLRSRNHGVDRLAEVHINQSLKDLAREARRFHSAASSASSTSGTTEDSQSVAAPWQFYPGAEMSLAGDFTEDKLERVHDYLEGTGATLFARPRPTRAEQPPSPPPSMPASDQDFDNYMPGNFRAQDPAHYRRKTRNGPSHYSLTPFSNVQARAVEREEPYSGITVKYQDPEVEAHETDFSADDDNEDEDEDVESDDEDEAELEKEFLQELRREIEECIRTGKYASAISQIDDLMLNHNAASEPEFMCTLRAQLALCHIMQGQLAHAEHLMGSHVAKFKKDRDPIVCSLLHALALLQYDNDRLEVAEKTCKLSYFGKKQLLKDKMITEESLWETVGLLAAIYAAKGETIKSNTFRRKWPTGFVYKQPASAKHFLLGEKALEGIVREDVATLSAVPGYFEMGGPYDEPSRNTSGGTDSSGSHSDKQTFGADYPSDSGDDPISPASSISSITPTRNLRRRFTQIFRSSHKRSPVSPVSPPNKRRPSIDSGYSSGITPVEDVPSSASPDHSPWNLFRTQTVKRKKTTKQPKPQKPKKNGRPFRVRNVVRVNHSDYLDVDRRHFDQQSLNNSTLSGSTMVEPERSPVAPMTAIYEVEEDTSGLETLPELGIPELDGHCTELPLLQVHDEKHGQALSSSTSSTAETRDDFSPLVLGSSVSAAKPLPALKIPTKPVLRIQPVVKDETTLGPHSNPPPPSLAHHVPSYDPTRQDQVVLPPATNQKILNVASLLTRKTGTFLEAEDTRLLLRMALANLRDTKWSRNPTLESDISKALEVVGMKASRLKAAAHAKKLAGHKTEQEKKIAGEISEGSKAEASDDDIWWETPEVKANAQTDVEATEDDDWWVTDKPSFSRATTLDVAELEATPVESSIGPSFDKGKASAGPDPKHTPADDDAHTNTKLHPETDTPYFIPGEMMEEKVSAVNLTKRPIKAYTPTSPKASDRKGIPALPKGAIKAYTPVSPHKRTVTKAAADEFVPAIAAHYVAAYGYMKRWKTSLAPDERDCLEQMGILT